MRRNKLEIFVGFFGLVLLGILVWGTLLRAPRAVVPVAPHSIQASPNRAAQARLIESYGKLPLSFEENQGQTAAEVKFLSRGRGYTLFLTGDEAVFSLASASQKSKGESQKADVAQRQPSDVAALSRLLEPPALFNLQSSVANHQSAIETPAPNTQHLAPDVIRLKVVGANPRAKVIGVDELPGKSNYFMGNDPKKWRTNVPTYAKVRYKNVYPGIDLVYYGNAGRLEYDFFVAPGANPNLVRLNFEHAKGIRLDNASGDLVLNSAGGEVRFHKPDVYQAMGHGKRTKNVEGNFVLSGKNQVAFQLAAYDSKEALVIDPVLSYSTYLGGSGYDAGGGIAVDSSGNAYIAGTTASSNFPTTSGAFQTTFKGGAFPFHVPADAFVTKLNPTGTALVYTTYLGGTGGESGGGVAVDSAGNAYVTGGTDSTDFPVTAGAFQTTFGGSGFTGCCQPGDAFVTKLNPAGSALVYSTFLGGSGWEVGHSIAIDGLGNAYVAGETHSTNFPVTAGAFQTSFRGSYGCGGNTNSGFATKLNPSGTGVVYSTYLGGGGFDSALGIAVDSAGNAYVTGHTTSNDFPTTSGAFQTSPANAFCGGDDAFVTKLNATGGGVYSTYLGGSGLEVGVGIAVDAAGNAYVSGYTSSTNFPTTPGSFQTTFGGIRDAFVTKLNPTGTGLAYSTFLGGSGDDFGQAIAIDAAGHAYVTGGTNSSNFPTSNPIQATLAGGYDAFLTKLDAAGTGLVYSTYLGGSGDDASGAIALDALPNPNAYVAGGTGSTNFPTTPGAFQTTFGGVNDAFLAKISQFSPTTTTLTSSANPSVFGQSVTFTATVSATGATGTVTFQDGATALGTATLTSGQATFITSSLSVGSHSVTATYGGDASFSGSTSSALTQSVNKASTSTSVRASPTPSILNQSVTFTATVTVLAPGAGTPTGTVTFQDGATTIGTATLNGSASTTLSSSSLTVGAHTITGQYNGDSNFLSSSGSLTQTVEYGVCALYDQTRSVKSGAVFPIKIDLCDVNGSDVSSPAIVVHATQITAVSGFSGTPEDVGNANPDNDFRFDSTLGPTGGYIFNLSTSGLASGTYSLQFTATGDPATHSVNFGVK